MKLLLILIATILACQLVGSHKHGETSAEAEISAKAEVAEWEKMNTSGIVYIIVETHGVYHVMRGSVWHTSDSIDKIMSYVDEHMSNAALFAVFGGLLDQKKRDNIYLRITKPKEGVNARKLVTFQVLSAFVPSVELKDVLRDRHSQGEQDPAVAGTSGQRKADTALDHNAEGLVYIIRKSSRDFQVLRGFFREGFCSMDMAMEDINKNMVNAELISFVSFEKLDSETQEELYLQIVHSKGPNSRRVFSFLMPSSDDSGVVDLAPALRGKARCPEDEVYPLLRAQWREPGGGPKNVNKIDKNNEP